MKQFVTIILANAISVGDWVVLKCTSNNCTILTGVCLTGDSVCIVLLLPLCVAVAVAIPPFSYFLPETWGIGHQCHVLW